MDFKNIAKKYRPVPFWSWNEKRPRNRIPGTEKIRGTTQVDV